MAASDERNSLDFKCDWRFGFNLSANRQGTVGYLLSWQGCGGLRLTPDLEVWNPFEGAGQTVVSGAKISCVGLVEQFWFNGDQSDPIRLSAYVSKGVAADLRAKLARPLTNRKLQTAFYVIDYDDERKQWFEACFIKNKKSVEAVVDSMDGELQLFVERESEKISATLNISVHKMEFQIVPAQGKTAQLEFATGPSRRLVKQWGG